MRKRGDKILDNSYNSGNIEPEFFHSRDLRVDDEFALDNLEEYLDNEKYNRSIKLLEIIEKLTKNTKYSIHGHPKKKMPKARLNEYLCFVIEGIKKEDTTYTMVEMVIGICEFIGCSYENMFKEMDICYKERVLSELDKEYNVLSKMNIKRLF